MASVLPFSLIFLPVATILTAIVATVALRFKKSTRWVQRISIIALGVSLGELLYMRFRDLPFDGSLFDWQSLSQAPVRIPVAFHFDETSFLFSLIALFVALIVVLLAEALAPKVGNGFYTLTLFITLASLNLYHSSNLIWLCAGWGSIGLAGYFLVSYQAEEQGPNNGAKRFFTTSCAATFILFAAILVVAVRNGTLDIAGINPLTLTPEVFLPVIIAAATASCLYPFNLWLGSSNRIYLPSSILLHAGMLVPSGIYLLLRFHLLFGDVVNSLWNRSLVFIGVIALVMGSYHALRERDARLAIVYDTTVQMGVAFLGLSIGTPLAVGGVLLHLIGFVIAKSGQLIFTGNRLVGPEPKFGLLQVQGTRQRNILGILVAASAGVPFLIGFYARWILANAAVDSGNNLLALIILGINAISFAYQFRVPHLLSQTKSNHSDGDDKRLVQTITGLLAGFAVLFGTIPWVPVGLFVGPILVSSFGSTPLVGNMMLGLSPQSDPLVALSTLGILLTTLVVGLFVLAFLLSDDFIGRETEGSQDSGARALPDESALAGRAGYVGHILNHERAYSSMWRAISAISAACRNVIAPFEQSHYVATVLFVVLGMILILLG